MWVVLLEVGDAICLEVFSVGMPYLGANWSALVGA